MFLFRRRKGTKLSLDEWLKIQTELEKQYQKVFSSRIQLMTEMQDIQPEENEITALIKTFLPQLLAGKSEKSEPGNLDLEDLLEKAVESGAIDKILNRKK